MTPAASPSASRCAGSWRRRRRPPRARPSSRCASSTSSAGRRIRASSIRGSRRRRSSRRSIRSAASVRVDFCRPPTLARMEEMLRDGQQAGDPYDLVHFDGHGTFLPQAQIGALCFEKPDDGSGESATDLVPADRLGDLLASYTIPLVVLEACRSATVGKTAVFRSVAPRLIQAGVGSVLSMGHAVHVEAARLLLDRFYRELVRGTTIGHAVAEARKALRSTPARWIESGPGGRTDRAGRLVPAPPLPARRGRRAHPARCRPAAAGAAVRPLPQPQAQRRHPRRGARPRAHGEARPARLAGQMGDRPGQSGASVRGGHPEQPLHRRRRLTDGAEVEMGPVGDRQAQRAESRGRPADPDQVRSHSTLPEELNDLLWVDFTDPAQDADNAALLARLIRSADAEDARRRRGFRGPASRA